MSNHWHRGHRAARRADRRRKRNWTIAAVVGGVVVLLAAGGFAAATVLAGSGDADVTTQATTRSAPTTVPVAGTTITTAVPHPCRTGLTPDAPLRLWIAGDSLAYSVGNGLGKRAAKTGVVAPVYESRVSSGLASPGFFDWPERVAEELPRLDPEVVVFVMGTNDWALPQDTPTDASGQPAWKAAYAAQVQGMVDALTEGGRTLYWVGPPVLRDSQQEAGAKKIAAVIRDVVERDPDSEFVDEHDLLDAADGSYTAALEINGKKVQVRTGDGVHLTTEGGDYLGDALFARLDAQCHLDAQSVPGSPQPVVETEGSTSVAPGSTATAPPLVTTPPTTVATTQAPQETAPTTEPTVPATEALPVTTTSATTPTDPTEPTLPE